MEHVSRRNVLIHSNSFSRSNGDTSETSVPPTVLNMMETRNIDCETSSVSPRTYFIFAWKYIDVKEVCGWNKEKKEEKKGDGKMERYSSINMSGCRNGKRSLPGTKACQTLGWREGKYGFRLGDWRIKNFPWDVTRDFFQRQHFPFAFPSAHLHKEGGPRWKPRN